MVNIHHHEPMAPVPDAGALEIFEQQWSIYRKFIEHDYGGHVGAYGVLHGFLMNTFAGPFSILDLGCGDATAMISALKGTRVAHYHGVDLAPPALELAARNLDALDCEVALEHGDYFEAVRDRPEPADVVWIGLSLHHFKTPEKRSLMQHIRHMMGPEGYFLTYEPTCLKGEDRAAYIDRYETIARRRWIDLAPDELVQLMKHVSTSDYPESVTSWRALGREAGFARVDELFSSETDLFRMFGFSG